jgi:hypothetical protein
VKRLALPALLLASSSLVAAPAPFEKPRGKAERPAPARKAAVSDLDGLDEAVIANAGFAGQFLGAVAGAALARPAQAPAQSPSADPPG